MPTLFSPLPLGPLTLPNRVIMAPLTRCRAGAGNVPHALNATYYAQRASAGLIISEATQVSLQGVGYPGTPGLHSAEQVAGWRGVTDAVHAAGGRIFAQLWHTGRVSHSSYQPDGRPPVAPSALAAAGQTQTLQGMVPFETPRALTTDEIAEIVNDYRLAALNARDAGFDGVELHGANGYLVDQFLRDGTNQRTDHYGGSVSNRLRFAREVLAGLVSVWGADRVGVRLSPSGTFNDMKDSNPEAHFGHIVTELGKLGLAYLHIMEAMAGDKRHGGQPIPASFFRPLFTGTLITNGGFTQARAAEYLRAGYADAIAFGTAFLANPDLPTRFLHGAPLNAPEPSTFYGGGAKGYIDYPALASSTA
jgi:N-ethylmaleimide reductase